MLKALGGNSKRAVLRAADAGLPAPGDGVARRAWWWIDDANALPDGVQARVLLNEDAAFLPDLEVDRRR